MQGGTKVLSKIYQKAFGITDFKRDSLEESKKEEIVLKNLEKNKEKEIEVLLQECDALRTEAMLHLEAQYQLANISLLLFGGLAAGAGLLFGLNAPNLHLTMPNLYILLLFLVLITCLLSSSLLHAFLSHQHDLGLIGVYINQVTRPRLRELLGKKEAEDSQFFYWDHFHQQRLTSGSRWSWLVSAALTSAHLGIEVILALLMITIAAVIYIANISFFTEIFWGWAAVGLFIFDIIYLLVGIPVVIETVGLFKQITQSNSTISV